MMKGKTQLCRRFQAGRFKFAHMRGQLSLELLLSFAAFLAVLFLLSNSLSLASRRAISAASLGSAHSTAMKFSLEASEIWLSCRHCSHGFSFSNCSADSFRMRCSNSSTPTIAPIEGAGGFQIHATKYEPI